MATLKGTNFADSLYGTSGADTIFGYDGNDTLKGGGGADHLDGGAGIDTVFYGDSNVGVSVNLATGHGAGGTADGDTYVSIENVYGSSFNDTLTGDDGANALYGLAGNDILKGGGGSDTLDGGDGDDILKGGGGADTLAGGAGNDTVDYSQSGPTNGMWGVQVDLVYNDGVWGDAQGDTFSSIENVTGSAYEDWIDASDGDNVVRGLDGDDQLTGRGGNDILDGGNGNDVLDGGSGIDTLTGGAGDDLIYTDDPGDVVNEGVGQGHDEIRAGTSYALSATAEIEVLSALRVNATTPQDLSGNDFSQSITGNEGANVLQGFGGADTLMGGGGFDRLFGGDGDDLLWGGTGADDLIGGTGADHFVYHAATETGLVAGTIDVIHDFNPAEGDVIDLAQADSNILVAGNQDWTFVGTNAFTAPGQVGVSSDGVDTFILLNIDNDTAAEAAIRVAGVHSVDASWFVL